MKISPNSHEIFECINPGIFERQNLLNARTFLKGKLTEGQRRLRHELSCPGYSHRIMDKIFFGAGFCFVL